MIQTITSERIPIKLWLDTIEPEAMAQCRNLANLPFAFKHIAVMPDAHVGYGMPIGGVLATKGVVIPNAVGVDIGCGMVAVRTSFTDIHLNDLKKIMGEIRKTIPVGFEHNKTSSLESMPDTRGIKPYYIVEQEFKSATKQVGSLGGGNHFIEVQKGSDGRTWIMIHSGSRNIGLKVAGHYNRLAKKLNAESKIKVDPKADLAYLELGSKEGDDYLWEMNYCLEFARANRNLMKERIEEIFRSTLDCDFEDEINIHHNYAATEEHFGEKVMVHRKGATSARAGEMGIIPGCQGMKSYIVKGKGSPESFCSCSHGAGRVMGRNQAIKNLDLEEEIKKLEEKGILHAIRGRKSLDEAPGAYKDISVVMKNQEDLVDVVVELSPLGVVKG
ncbi:MAG: RtcB family protein [Candidatus Omnitrophica bacterium]|nr:RtcB family protein [Candidatus Omnitrophota bacterium]